MQKRNKNVQVAVVQLNEALEINITKARSFLTALLCIIVAGSTVFAQDTIRKKRFYIGAFASPDYSYRVISEGSSSIYNYIVSDRNAYEIPKIAYTVGAEALYQIHKRLAVSLGIQYSVKGENTKDRTLVYGSQVDPRRGYIINGVAVPVKSHFNYNMRYIDIPVRIDFYLSKKKIAPFITTGVSTNIYINEKVTSVSTYEDGRTDKTTDNGRGGYHTINPQFQFGFGMDATFKKTRLRVFPIYRMSFVNITSGPIKDYYYSIGLGINYFFGL